MNFQRKDTEPNFPEEWKRNPFEVPAGYFDELPAKIQVKIAATKQPKTKILVWIPRVALSGLLLLLLLFFWQFQTKEEPIPAINSEIAYQELTMNLSTLDETLLVSELDTFSVSYHQPAELETYLLEHTHLTDIEEPL
ncbi:MAG: hypothetical protein NZ108_09645 [Bacteroidia bacterium]|nr:hypothetical protein [Bacteroidia bacterium]